MELLEIDFPALVADPQPVLARLAEFLGGAFTNGREVARCIRPELHRRR